MNELEFQNILKEKGIEVSEHQLQQFQKYYEILVEWNEKMNLTAITDKEDVYLKHFYDSITIAFDFDFNNQTLIDVGAVAGFPSVPLKILYPNLKITIVDSLNKRILFLEEVISELGLTGITAVHARAEELAKDRAYREQFDYCVSRAVANLSTLCEYCIPFVKEGGKFISYKSGEIEEESAAAKHAVFLLGGELKEIHKFEIPQTDLHRSFVVIEKVKKTPKAYPRKAGTPSKMPLK